ncbi:MAG: hypothetical protein P8Y23_01105 [Candidatus Lokiarchaeota archaeon]
MAKIKEDQNINRDLKAKTLIRETKVLNIARLATMLVDLFGIDELFENIGTDLENQEVELYLRELEGYITFILTSDRQKFECRAEQAKNPIAKIIITVKEEKIIKVISAIIRSKSNVLGIIKLLKYLIPRKAIIEGSYKAAIKLVRCLMIGKNKIFKQSKEGVKL